jgi:YHS domain-containing protein
MHFGALKQRKFVASSAQNHTFGFKKSHGGKNTYYFSNDTN